MSPTNSKSDHTPPMLPEVGFVRLPLILRVFPVGRSTWWSGVRSGRFPPAVKLGPGVTAWRVEDIRQLLNAYEAKGVPALKTAGATGRNSKKLVPPVHQ